MKKILFIYNHQYSHFWQDGLWAAIEELQSSYKITKINLATTKVIDDMKNYKDYDLILGWGGFNSSVDNAIQLLKQLGTITAKTGLCLAGNAFPLSGQKYDVLFYETEWTKKWLLNTAKSQVPKNLHYAFGYNSNIYNTIFSKDKKIIDYLTVGAFALWKRQIKLKDKGGVRMAIGEIQKDNLSESMAIIGPLIMDGVIISNMMEPKELAHFYRLSKKVYIPADIYGGGERAVLEARACDCQVEIESDNPKLQELLTINMEKMTERDYAAQLKHGIEICFQ